MPRPENDKTLKDIPQGAIILNVLQQRGFDPAKFVPRDYQCRSVMVYRGNNEILDSATAKGARVVNLSDRLNAQQEPKPALFSILTVHHKNPKVQKELGRIVNLDAHIGTLYTQFSIKTSEDNGLRNLARAFKNAARINANEKISEGKMQNASIFIPGNKEKLSINMSEVDFASYIMQAAIINVLFPQGIPKTLINKLDEIGRLDKASDQSLKEFKELFDEEIKKVNIEDNSLIAELNLLEKVETHAELYNHVSAPDAPWEINALIRTPDGNLKCVAPGYAKKIVAVQQHSNLNVSIDNLKNAGPVPVIINKFLELNVTEYNNCYSNLSNTEKEQVSNEQELFFKVILINLNHNKIYKVNFEQNDFDSLKKIIKSYNDEPATLFRWKSQESVDLATKLSQFIGDKKSLTYQEKIELYLMMKPYMDEHASKGGTLASNIQILYGRLEHEVGCKEVIDLYNIINDKPGNESHAKNEIPLTKLK